MEFNKLINVNEIVSCLLHFQINIHFLTRLGRKRVRNWIPVW